MADADQILIRSLRGGRNGIDPPNELSPDQCVEALNVDWYQASFARKRGGSTSVTETGGTAFSSGIQSLFRHVPGASEAAAELWGIDGAATPIVKRMTGGTSFANVTMADAIATSPHEVNAATLNGKLFLAYDSSVDRLHAYDPALGTPQVRRVGLGTPAAPTAADTAVAGAYPATLIYIRVRWIQYSSSLVVRRSEAGAAVSFTPNGAFTGVVVTRPTAASESETHWEVEVSTDNATFYAVAQASTAIAIATTTYTLTILQTDFSDYTLSETSGEFTAPTSVKYLLTDGNRLLLAGAWETGGKNSRVWFTPVLGSTDHADDERIPNATSQKNWVDLNENDGGFITGLGGPFDGAPWAFKYRQIWKLVPTGDVDTPYIPRKRTDGIGCIQHKSIVVAEDEQGRPALYFMSHRGPYRVGQYGLQYLGRDNEDIWHGSMNLAATTTTGFTLWHVDKRQVWFYIATGSANTPDVKMCFDVRLGSTDEKNQVRGGWSKHTGDSCEARCGVMFSNTLGATMSRDLKPYIGQNAGNGRLWKCDTTDQDDAGTAFQGLITYPDRHHGGLDAACVLRPPLVLGSVGSHSITVTMSGNYGALTTRTGSVAMAAAGSETRVLKPVEDVEIGDDVFSVAVAVGDASAAATPQWTIDAVIVPVERRQSLVTS
jgi:hypothetical protein